MNPNTAESANAYFVIVISVYRRLHIDYSLRTLQQNSALCIATKYSHYVHTEDFVCAEYAETGVPRLRYMNQNLLRYSCLHLIVRSRRCRGFRMRMERPSIHLRREFKKLAITTGFSVKLFGTRAAYAADLVVHTGQHQTASNPLQLGNTNYFCCELKAKTIQPRSCEYCGRKQSFVVLSTILFNWTAPKFRNPSSPLTNHSPKLAHKTSPVLIRGGVLLIASNRHVHEGIINT